MRAPKPIWLAAPTRFSGLSRVRARWIVAALALLIAASLTAIVAAGPPPNTPTGDRNKDKADVVLYETIIDGMKHGENYYIAAAEAQRALGYPLRPFVTIRMPTLATVESLVPYPVAVGALWLMCLGVLAAWAVKLRPVFHRIPPYLIALVLLGSGLMVFAQPDLVVFHEVWAGLFIALSLAVRRQDRWVEAVALGLCAMLIRETAALYVIVMAGLALVEGRRREMLGWGAALVVLAVAVALHAHAVAGVVRPSDAHSPGWMGMLGFGFFVKTITICTSLHALPLFLSAPLIGLSLFGWASWRDPAAMRALATFCAYALLLSLFGRPDTFYWGLLVTPALIMGLAFAVDGVRDLGYAALERRRITVTRLTP